MIDTIRKLREKTGAGIVDCKKALKDAGGSMEKAIEILRKKGVALATKHSTRSAKEGRIDSYIHLGGKIGVLVEVSCESDFVARNEDFKIFVRDVSMQIAASNPIYIKKEEVPKEVTEKEIDIFKAQIDPKKPEIAVEKIIEGKLNKFYEDSCLLEQPFVKDTNLKVKDILMSMIAKIGENIVIRRFVRFQVGEDLPTTN
ncbi:MAG: translation elongation factor Ts [Candidatus Omnitrophota bacterium]